MAMRKVRGREVMNQVLFSKHVISAIRLVGEAWIQVEAKDHVQAMIELEAAKDAIESAMRILGEGVYFDRPKQT